MRRGTLLLLVLAGVGLVGNVSLASHFDGDASTGAFNPQMAVTVTQTGVPMLVDRPTAYTLNITQADHEDPPVFTRLRSPGDWQFAFTSTRPAEAPGGVPATQCKQAIDGLGDSPNGTGSGGQLDFSKRTNAKFVRAEKIGRVHLEVHADGITRPGVPAAWDGDVAFISYDSITDAAKICALFISTDSRVTTLPDTDPSGGGDDIEGVTEIVGEFPVAHVSDGANLWWETFVDLSDLATDSTFQQLNVSLLQLRGDFFARSAGNWNAGALDFSRAPHVSGSKTFQGVFQTCPANDPAYGSCKSGRPVVTRSSSFTFALVAPAITAPAPGVLLNTNPVAISGTSDPAASVQIFEGTTPVGAPAAANASGAWTANVSLPDGSHTVLAKVVDAGGASPASNSRSFTLDTTPPNPPVISAPAQFALVGGTSVTLSGTAESGSRVEVFEGALSLGTTTATGGAWSMTKTFTKGTHAIMARATDVANNVGALGDLRTFDVTTAAPTIAAPAENGATNAASVTISGISEPNALIALDEQGTSLGTVPASAAGAWSTSLPFAEGTHRITATATAGGFVSPATSVRTFVVDFTAPAAPVIVSPAASQIVRSISVPVRGTMDASEAGASVAVFEVGTRIGTAIVDTTGAWATTVVLPDGVHKIRAVATDRAGNVGVSSPLTTFTVDDPLEIVTPAANSLNPGSVVISGGADPLATQVRVFEGPAEIARTAVVDGSWSVSRAFATGTHTIYARAVNGGVLGPPSPSQTFKVDATPPTVKIRKPSGYSVFGVLLGEPVSGYASDAAPADSRLDRVEIEYTNQLTGDVTVVAADCVGCAGGSNATWSDSSAPLPGFYSVKATAYDRVGNTATDTVLLLIV